ncbi:MAG TPA: SDR family oxidoreductase [Verrucomicrobiae bacterium]|nr:SDR family oxidoreductase [Verrucomicrobiae bacterium]
MTSKFWDDKRAAACRDFRFDFPANALAGRSLILAGGTGGLGSATALLLASEGAHLILGYRGNAERAAALAAVVESRSGSRPVLVDGDIAEPQVRAKYLEAAGKSGAPLAGAAIFPGDPARVSWEKLDRQALSASFDVNFTGPALLAKDLGEVMDKNESGGSIVLLSTMQAIAAFPGSLNYAAPKAALVHAAKILAQQWSRVRVNVVAPGATFAGMAAASVQSGKYDRYVETGAIPRFGRPEDVARAVRFFLEPDNYVTGQVLAVDGGLTLRRDRG